jgi:hypothetical protein
MEGLGEFKMNYNKLLYYKDLQNSMRVWGWYIQFLEGANFKGTSRIAGMPVFSRF